MTAPAGADGVGDRSHPACTNATAISTKHERAARTDMERDTSRC